MNSTLRGTSFRALHLLFIIIGLIKTVEAIEVFNWRNIDLLGLYRDDCLYEEHPDVQEALRRLPKHVIDERNFRLIRAIQLDINRKLLPKEEWIRYEDDILYLTPIVDQVRKERLEREKWDKEHWNVFVYLLLLFNIVLHGLNLSDY